MPEIKDLATIRVLSSTPGNDWETGAHDVAPAGRRPKIVPKGMTHRVDLLNARGDVVLDGVRLQLGSGLTHDDKGREIPLDPGSVIAGQLRDAEYGSDTFPDFCASLGYDEDSRKALDIYLKCQAADAALRRGFTPAELETLRELTEEM